MEHLGKSFTFIDLSLFAIKELCHISEKEFSESLDKIKEKASLGIESNISLRQFTLNYARKEKEARKYGRFRQIDLFKATVKELRNYSESCDDSIKDFVKAFRKYMSK